MTAIAIAVLAVGTVGTTVRYLPITNHVTLILAALSSFLMLGAPLSAVALALLRRWIAAIVAICLTIATIAVHLPLYVPARSETAPRTSLRVMTANVQLGLTDAAAFVATARSEADIVAVQELTSDEVSRFSNAGLDQTFPYRVIQPRDIAAGTGLWSRYPLQSPALLSGFENAFISARIHISGVAIDPAILVAHMAGPWPYPVATWGRDLGRLPFAMEDVAKHTGSGCVIVAGDFNSTISMRPYRALLRDGYSDAAEQAGAGMLLTYPADSWIPPVLGIDHVIVRNCVTSALKTAPLPGSDHRAIVGTVEIP
jgi:endonuclease/exonuclease/phosphatase (EEP) superfamily protein YafD